jgi:c-di-GMP-binding flagellar brake protein YcgR
VSEFSEGERRSFKRFKFQQPVEFHTKDTSLVAGSLSGDISQGGIRLRLFKFLPIQSEVTLSVYLNPTQLLECSGRVVWIEEDPGSERFQIGIEFERKESSVNQTLSKFLDVYKPQV